MVFYAKKMDHIVYVLGDRLLTYERNFMRQFGKEIVKKQKIISWPWSVGRGLRVLENAHVLLIAKITGEIIKSFCPLQ